MSGSQLAQQVQVSAQVYDVASLRPEKWKADANSRQDAQAGILSIRRNLTYAVPELVKQLQAAPDSLNANFRLYRNLNALYDTLSALAESAGAFAPREQYDPLAADLGQLDQLRHQAADRIEQLAGASDAELSRLRTQPATPAKPVTKVIVDDEQPKPKKKSKPATTPQTSSQ